MDLFQVFGGLEADHIKELTALTKGEASCFRCLTCGDLGWSSGSGAVFPGHFRLLPPLLLICFHALGDLTHSDLGPKMSSSGLDILSTPDLTPQSSVTLMCQKLISISSS